MAGASLFALLDDITTLLDDVATMTKVAAKKTAGVLGDDLAVNAERVTGVRADRELPVVWAVAKGSAINKLILVPAALAVSALLPVAVTLLLIAGGIYLCFEGVEKIAHRFLHAEDDVQAHAALRQAARDPAVDMVAFEQDKIRGAIRTDFVLSAEIIVITLGTVTGAPFGTRVAVLAGISTIMTVGVYGLVAGIVKLDDLGLALAARPGDRATDRMLRAIGRGIRNAAPWLMKTLSVAGTAAMFLVGGGILTHGIPLFEHAARVIGHTIEVELALGGVLTTLATLAFDALVGILAGALTLLAVELTRRALRRRPAR